MKFYSFYKNEGNYIATPCESMAQSFNKGLIKNLHNPVEYLYNLLK